MDLANLIVPSVISIVGFIVTIIVMVAQFKNTKKQKSCWNKQIIHPARCFVILRFSYITDNKNAKQRDKYHRYIIRVPTITSYCSIRIPYKLPFTYTDSQPNNQHHTNRHQNLTNLFFHNSSIQRHTPCHN